MPGPTVGFLADAVRWWDRWLKGIDNGIMAEPRLRAWMQESQPPRGSYPERPGRWVAEATWPSPHIHAWTLRLGDRTLGEDDDETTLTVCSPPPTGEVSGEWCAFGVEGEHPIDQRADDGRSLVFETEPLAEAVEILGTPRVTLALAADQPQAMVAIRLNDVAPDGASTRVTYGLLNLAQRDSREEPALLVPGQRFVASIRLNDIAHAFPAGHRIRLAVSSVYWPIAWPSPAPATLTVHTSASALHLPLRPPRAEDAALPAMPPPEQGPAEDYEEITAGRVVRKMMRDIATGEHAYVVERASADSADPPRYRVKETGMEIAQRFKKRYSIRESDPLSARSEFRYEVAFHRDDWSVSLIGETTLTATTTTFEFAADLTASSAGSPAFAHAWRISIPRENL